MMRVAIAAYEDRVASVIDSANRLVLFEPDISSSSDVLQLKDSDDLNTWVEILRKKSVELLICGAIANDWLRYLQLSGFRVLPWVRGKIVDIVSNIPDGIENDSVFIMPGCRRRRRRFGGPPGRGRKIF